MKEQAVQKDLTPEIFEPSPGPVPDWNGGDLESQLADQAAVLAGHAAAGNAFVAEAVARSRGASLAFETVDAGAFAADGVGASSALESAQETLFVFAAWDDEELGWSTELGEARESLEQAREAASVVDDGLLSAIDADLGLRLDERVEGTGSERIDHALTVGSAHLEAGAELRAKGDVLSDVEGETAMGAATHLAREYRDGQEDGTERFYNTRMEESGASDALKGYFAYGMGIADSAYYLEYDDTDQTCALTDAGLLEALRLTEEAQRAQAATATQDFGKMSKPLEGGLARRGGQLAELLVPGDGDKAKLAIEVEVPVATVGVAKTSVNLSFVSEVENADGQIALGAKAGVGVEAEIDVGLSELELAIGAMGVLKASGDSGVEAFELMLYGLADGVQAGSQRAHDLLFGGMDKAAIEAGMDKDDYAERGIGFYAGAALERGTLEGGEESVSGRYERLSGARLQKGRDGEVKSKSFDDHTVSGALDLDGGGGELNARLRENAKGMESMSIEGKASMEVPPEQMRASLTSDGLLSQAMQQVSEIGLKMIGLAGDPKGAEPAAKTMGRLARAAGLDRKLLAQADDALAARQLGGASQSYALGISLTATGKSVSGEVTLEEVNTIEAELEAGAEIDVEAEMSRMVAKVKLA